ncbi:MAG TPA: LysR family transcriptional regulator [Candidatus Scatomonas pullistercoris]|uniref:LysR family transcriptional regulator n=1 Tax=Candidatus Scatomonas pullistercoris TaxID=2840920 RepID=A0A9D1P0N1_9FIRM|nr:LysR family transcriptional regulator [Candidatus Scatomonas pullistercoris]
MELRTLRYFLTVAEEENITHAADILHITQPTLSRQMMDLEKELGTTLMIRGKSGLTLTGDGLFLKQRTEEIIELADRLEQAFAERNTYVSGVISIGATEAVGSRLFARLIREFSNKYPQIKFKLYNEMADYIKDSIDKGLIDVGLLLEPIDTAKYDFVRLSQKETWGVLMRDDHPLAGNTSITPEDIAEYPLILPLRERPRREIIDWMKREEKDLNIPVSYTLLSNAALLVEEGMGCAFCLDGALAIRSSPHLRFIPIYPEHTTHSILMWKKNHLFSSATSLFIQEINMLRAKIE